MDQENPIFRSLALIEEKIHERLTVENLAQNAHFSKYHYQRIFREAVGESVMQYVTRRRISLAAGELAGTDSNILEIALKYGYDSHEGFTRSFRTAMGVTPAEYRKYCHSISSPLIRKEKSNMLISDSAGEMIRELNGLIVQAKETAAYAKRHAASENVTAYSPFWSFIISKTDKVTDELSAALDRISSITQKPDEISARFMIVKVIDDAVFWYGLIAFQTGLTVKRAVPEHRSLFLPICGRYDKLARDARIRADKIVSFLGELSSLIFQEMKDNAQQKLQEIIKKGESTVKILSADTGLPYSYIAEEISNITQELSTAPFPEITARFLEDCLFRLDIIAFSADLDARRCPSHHQLLGSISQLREQLRETTEFFQSLPDDVQAAAEAKGSSMPEYTPESKCRNIAFQGNILLFYLKGETQKLGGRILKEDQEAALNAVCDEFNKAIRLAMCAADQSDADRLRDMLRALYDSLTAQAQALGIYGAPIQHIAEEIKMISV